MPRLSCQRCGLVDSRAAVAREREKDAGGACPRCGGTRNVTDRAQDATRRSSVPAVALGTQGTRPTAVPVIRVGASLKGAATIATTHDGQWEHHAAAVASNVGVMRTGVVSFAARHGASLRAQTDIALAVSEAVTNSVVHAFVHQPAGTISLFAEAGVDALHVRITDDGSGMSPRSDSPGMGLGLNLIAHLTSSFDHGAGPSGRGTEMRLSFDAPGVRPMAPATRAPRAL